MQLFVSSCVFKIKNMKNLPDIGKVYNYFDDGKIKETRKMECIITEIIPFDKIDSENLELWKEEINECDWLYKKETDYFIKADLKITDNEIEKIVFVRMLQDNWFSLGWWSGQLDVDGSLTQSLTT